MKEKIGRHQGMSGDEYLEFISLDWDTHLAKVRAYFNRDIKHKLLEFDIESDDPQKIADFCSPDLVIDPSKWECLNKAVAITEQNYS